MGLNTFIDSGTANLQLIEELYTKYLEDPLSVDPSWCAMFEAFDASRLDFPAQSIAAKSNEKQEIKKERDSSDWRIFNLIESYRTYGHLLARINPIATHSIEEPLQLSLKTLGFSEQEVAKQFPTCGLLEQPTATLAEIINVLKEIYCDKIGVEYMGLQSPQLEHWLQERIERTRFKIELSIEQKKLILQHLNKSELLESFLHTKYVGQKRFSLEGGETLIPMLAAIIETGTLLGCEEFIIGMAHRGRLNVLCNILNKSYADIFSEFDESYIPDSFEGSGDVKYHKGFSSDVQTNVGKKVQVLLTSNPSHLEAVDAVVEGLTFAKQVLKHDDIAKEKVLPILIHGDAALAGQGIVYETMQLYQLEGYSTGGTIHIVINNQIGFTTLPRDTRSTYYCTDIARTFGAPVFHVNAEDPEGCIYVTNLAIELRNKFHCDVFIDLNCYRKYGHNETDEPAFTQPLEYQLIRKKHPIREIYRDALIHQGVLEKHMAETLESDFKKALQEELKTAKAPSKKNHKDEAAILQPPKDKNLFKPIETGVDAATLRQIAERASAIPEGFNIHPKLQHLIKEHLAMVMEEGKLIDWGMGELLAYGSLLWEGTPVRLSGQDSCRGTFSHRHAVWVDQSEERTFIPLKHLKKDQGRFDVINSPLSEYAVLGFEFGYSLGNPLSLVLWEAQFGDFSNGAQVTIDQFISTAEQKWGQKISLVMLLPHGYEGQGPEHSSGRMERFLALCGDDNMLVVNPTTPAQFFHLIRRQMKRSERKPLIVFTPKGLLRHPECTNPLQDFTQGSFQEILDDPAKPQNAQRLVLCSGRVYYDLIKERAQRQVKDLAILRIEQLYPLHMEKIKSLISQYPKIQECYWVQEEPSNMGAWDFVRPLLRELLPKNLEPKYIGRARSASPGAGAHALHKQEYATIMNALFSKQPLLFDMASKH